MNLWVLFQRFSLFINKKHKNHVLSWIIFTCNIFFPSISMQNSGRRELERKKNKIKECRYDERDRVKGTRKLESVTSN